MNSFSPKASVELFHLLLLDLLARKADPRHYALKGGCNLRFFMKSIRYSEDMDIDVSADLSKDKLAGIVERILASKSFTELLALKGLRIAEQSALKQTDTTQRWKFGLEREGSSVLLRTKIEFSRRGMDTGIALGPVEPLLIRSYALTPILARHYEPQTALDQKIRALAQRQNTQARDVFDLNLLLNSGITRGPVEDSLCRQAKKKAFTVTFDMYKAQVVSFLNPDYQSQYDSPALWDSMILRVDEALGERS